MRRILVLKEHQEPEAAKPRDFGHPRSRVRRLYRAIFALVQAGQPPDRESSSNRDPAEVEWAVATRFQADRDLVIVPESQGSKLDPSTRNGVGAKMGLDATKPLNADEMTFKRIRVPGEERVDVAKAIGPVPPSAWRKPISG